MSSRIAVLKVTLDGVKPTVMRRLVVPLTIRLDRLHLVLQATIGWTKILERLDAAIFQDIDELGLLGLKRTVSEVGVRYTPPNASGGDLIEVAVVYDFGDRWEHTVKVERIERWGSTCRWTKTKHCNADFG